MKTIAALETNAAFACEQAGFPLEELPHHTWGVRTDFRDRPLGVGREAYLPRRLFELKEYDLINPERAAEELQSRWIYGHPGAVLETTSQFPGTRLITHVAVEALFLAKGQHRANVALTAARIGLQGMTGGRETVFAVWDDGRQYESPRALEARFRSDAFRNLSSGYSESDFKLKGQMVNGVGINPTTPVVTTAEGFGGTLTVVSGKNRLDITKHGDEPYSFSHQSVSPIVGNVVVARVPYVDNRRSRKQ